MTATLKLKKENIEQLLTGSLRLRINTEKVTTLIIEKESENGEYEADEQHIQKVLDNWG